MSEPKCIWIRFPERTGDDRCPIRIDYKKKHYPTFEAFKDNFIRGWEWEGPAVVDYVVQDEEPDEHTQWSRAPEFQK